MNNDETFLPSETESKISDALEHRASKETVNINQKEWNDIMEESTNRSRRISRRTQLVSAAAAAAVIIAITGAILVVASNGGSNGGVKTVDKKKKDPVATSTTTTTIPLTTNQNLLLNTIQLKKVNEDGSNSFDIYDTVSGKKIGALPKDQNNVFTSILSFNGNTLTGGAYNGQDFNRLSNFTYFVKTGKIIETGNHYRVYSPSEQIYAEFDGLKVDSAQNITIVDVKTGKRRTLKPETLASFPAKFDKSTYPNLPKEYIAEVFWLDDTRFVFRSEIENFKQTSWKLADLRNPISLKDSPDVTDKDLDFTSGLLDIRKIDGKFYMLTYKHAGSEYDTILTVADIENKKIVWSKDFSGTASLTTLYGSFFLSNNVNVVYGLAGVDGTISDAFVYDYSTNSILRPGGDYVLPRR